MLSKYSVKLVHITTNIGYELIAGLTSSQWLMKYFPMAEFVDENVECNFPCIVLYDDTPLVDRQTIIAILEEMQILGITNCTLPRGFIKTDDSKGKMISNIGDFTRLRDASSYPIIYNKLKERIIAEHMERGVIIHAPNATYIDANVSIEPRVVIFPNNYLYGDTCIGEGSVLMPGNILTNSKVGKNSTLTGAIMSEAEVGDNTAVGPYAYLRPHSIVGNNCKIGDFVEIKNSTIADTTKVPHLTYVGDADVGKGVNVGCGVIFANYDGRNKHRTKIGDGAFIGSNSTLIAPIEVGNRVFIAAAATVTKNIPNGSLVIARVKETIKEGRAEAFLKK